MVHPEGEGENMVHPEGEGENMVRLEGEGKIVCCLEGKEHACEKREDKCGVLDAAMSVACAS